MTPQEELIKYTLTRFRHPERYETSQLFVKIVERIARGGDFYHIIEELLAVIEDQQKALNEKTRAIEASIPLTDEQVPSLIGKGRKTIGLSRGVPMSAEEAFKVTTK